MLKKIISGGQTGADIGGIDAAVESNFPYGGSLPRGRKTENGPLSEKYQMKEMTTGGYPKRTEQNVKDSDGTIIFTHKILTGGSKLTSNFAESWGKPWLHINLSQMSKNEAVSILLSWIKENKIEILNVAGSRASKDSEVHTKVVFLIREIITYHVQRT